MRKVLLAFVLIGAVAFGQAGLPPKPATPVPIIISHDAGSDIDDTQAIAILIRLHQLGYVRILAVNADVTFGSRSFGGWADQGTFSKTLLTYGGLSNVPVGICKYNKCNWGAAGTGGYAKAANDALGITALRETDFPTSSTVYRQVMDSATAGQVVLVAVGPLAGLMYFMQSAAGEDGIASDGATLFRKLKSVVVMGGWYPTSFYPPGPGSGPEYNFYNDNTGSPSAPHGTAANYLFTHNESVPIYAAGSDMGVGGGGLNGNTNGAITTGGATFMALQSAIDTTNPLYQAMVSYRTGHGCSNPPGTPDVCSAFTNPPAPFTAYGYGRSAWDLTAAFFAAIGLGDPGGGAYYTVVGPGTNTITVSTNSSLGGGNTWTASPDSGHYYLKQSRRLELQAELEVLQLAGFKDTSMPHPRMLLNERIGDTWNSSAYPGGGSNGRLSAVTARANGGNATATADWTTLRAIVPTGGTPSAFSNYQDEGSFDYVLAYGLSYAMYHKVGNDAVADSYALALYNGLKSATAVGTTRPVYDITAYTVASNVGTVTVSPTPGAELTAGVGIGVWGCPLANDAYCGQRTITGVSGSTITFSMMAANATIITNGMVATRGYQGVDATAQIGVTLASWAYLYDWCYPWLAANGKASEIVRYIKAAYWSATLTRLSSGFADNVRESDFHNYSVWLESSILEAGIALDGDDALGPIMLAEGLGYLYQGISIRPASAVNESYTYNLKASIDALTEGAMNWEGSTYWRAAALRILRAIEAYDSYTARSADLWNTQFSTVKNAGMYRLYLRDPAGTLASFGESANLKPYAGRDNIGLSIINDRFPDPHFVWMMSTGINSWNDGCSVAGLAWKLIFYPYVNGPGAHDLTDLPLSRRFGTDVVIRSGWGPTDTMFTLTGSLKGVYHRKQDAGGFSLYKSGYLAAPSNYETVGSPVYTGWMKRSIGANTITVYDPTDCWADKSASCGTTTDDFGDPLKITNDGGQRTTLRRLNPPFSVGEFNLSRAWSGTLYTDPTYGAAYNEVQNIAFPTLTAGSGYERVSVDISKAYTNSYSGLGDNVHAKTPTSGGVVRDVVHFQPVSGSIDPIIIFDKVVSTDVTFSKSWLLHTVGAPQVTDSWTAASAGINTVSASVMRADNGTGRLYVHSLLPAAPNLRTVGGNTCLPLTITAATNANPGVFTIPAHGLTVGERIGIDVGTYSSTSSTGYNSFGAHPNWLLDTNSFTVGSIIDADHVTLNIGATPWNTSSLQSFSTVFGNTGAGAPSSAGAFAGQMFYQTDANGGNSAWWWSGSGWSHIGANANNLTAPVIYKHSGCEYGYWVDQSGPQGSSGASMWRFAQDLLQAAAQPQWRVEFKPSVSAATDYFLNVLTPTSTSDSSGPTTAVISAAGWHGAQVTDGIETFVAMFTESAGSAGVSYTASHSGGGKHVVTGLAAAATYPVLQSGTLLGSATTDSSGALTFTETEGGTFTVGVVATVTPEGRIGGRATTSGSMVLR